MESESMPRIILLLAFTAGLNVSADAEEKWRPTGSSHTLAQSRDTSTRGFVVIADSNGAADADREATRGFVAIGSMSPVPAKESPKADTRGLVGMTSVELPKFSELSTDATVPFLNVPDSSVAAATGKAGSQATPDFLKEPDELPIIQPAGYSPTVIPSLKQDPNLNRDTLLNVDPNLNFQNFSTDATVPFLNVPDSSVAAATGKAGSQATPDFLKEPDELPIIQSAGYSPTVIPPLKQDPNLKRDTLLNVDPNLNFQDFVGKSGILPESQGSDDATGETYMDELAALKPVWTPSDMEAELDALINGQKPWIVQRGSLTDLQPGLPQDVGQSGSYLNDLKGLIDDSEPAPQQNHGRFAAYGSIRPAAPRAPQEQTYDIPASKACKDPGGEGVAGLFAPVGSITTQGHSTQPPEIPGNRQKLELKRPENIVEKGKKNACDLIEKDAPAYYFAHGYGLRRAPRNTYRFCHHPLYFEDPNLERCGSGNGCLTTVRSAALFGAKLVMIPYLTTVDHPRDCVRALPDCPTCSEFGRETYFPKWSWRAATVQAAAVTGLVFIIP